MERGREPSAACGHGLGRSDADARRAARVGDLDEAWDLAHVGALDLPAREHIAVRRAAGRHVDPFLEAVGERRPDRVASAARIDQRRSFDCPRAARVRLVDQEAERAGAHRDGSLRAIGQRHRETFDARRLEARRDAGKRAITVEDAPRLIGEGSPELRGVERARRLGIGAGAGGGDRDGDDPGGNRKTHCDQDRGRARGEEEASRMFEAGTRRAIPPSVS